MYKIGLSTCGSLPSEELFEACGKAGIACVEISPAAEDYDKLDYAGIKKWAKQSGLALWSYHLPFCPFEKIEISTKNSSAQTIEYFKELIRKGTDIGIDKFVIHPSGEPIEENDRAERMKWAKDSLHTLAEFADQNGARIAVEDLPRTCLGRNSKEILELLEAHEKLCVCFDTNHLLSEDPVEFVHEVGARIATLHVSDYDFVNERHWLPGEGKLDWQALLAALKETGYAGAFMYELRFTCPNTILRDRDLTCEDIVRNAGELFAGQTPTVFSKPKENLGYWG